MSPWLLAGACAGALVGGYVGVVAFITARVQLEARNRRKAARR